MNTTRPGVRSITISLGTLMDEGRDSRSKVMLGLKRLKNAKSTGSAKR